MNFVHTTAIYSLFSTTLLLATACGSNDDLASEAAPATASVVVNPTENLRISFSDGEMGLGDFDSSSLPDFVAEGRVDSAGNMTISSMPIPDVDDTVEGIRVTYVTEVNELPRGRIDPGSGAASASMTLTFRVKDRSKTTTLCTIGPIRFNLTTGSSGNMRGVPYSMEDGTLSLVDNLFTVPSASCKAYEGRVNSAGDLPASAGESTFAINARLSPILYGGTLQETEPNDTRSTADFAGQMASSVSGTTGSGQSLDYVEFTVPAGKTLTLRHEATTTVTMDSVTLEPSTLYTGPYVSLALQSSSGSTLANGSSTSNVTVWYDDPDCNKGYWSDCDDTFSTTQTKVTTTVSWRNSSSSTQDAFLRLTYRSGGAPSGRYAVGVTIY